MIRETVSVIVPCFNEERTIGLLLDALAGQTFPAEATEVLISDGRSTDRTRDVIRRWAEARAFPGDGASRKEIEA